MFGRKAHGRQAAGRADIRTALAGALLLTACSREATPVDPIPSKPAAVNVLASSAAEPAVTYVPTTLEIGVHVDVPSFMTHHAGGSEAAQLSGGGAKMTLIAEGECARSMKGFCRPVNSAEKAFARSMTESTCLETGVVGDRIVWRRRRIADGVEYEIGLEYPASEKVKFDPIVEHISKSWTVPAKTQDGYRCDVR